MTEDGRTAPTPGERGVYIAGKELVAAVNAAIAVEQPLLVTGEPGTGKTVLAFSIAAELELGSVEVFAVRSDQQGRDLLYDFDNLQRFYDAQVGSERAKDRSNYLHYGALGRVIKSGKRSVLLVDEIDKAPRDFANDLLDVLDQMVLRIPELECVERADVRPVVVITSNRESQLPDAFLRRCVFHHIEFPSETQLRLILEQRLGHLALTERLTAVVISRFMDIRAVDGLQKRPATDELLTWIRILHAAGVTPETLEGKLGDLPYLGCVLKSREDSDRLKKIG